MRHGTQLDIAIFPTAVIGVPYSQPLKQSRVFALICAVDSFFQRRSRSRRHEAERSQHHLSRPATIIQTMTTEVNLPHIAVMLSLFRLILLRFTSHCSMIRGVELIHHHSTRCGQDLQCLVIRFRCRAWLNVVLRLRLSLILS